MNGGTDDAANGSPKASSQHESYVFSDYAWAEIESDLKIALDRVERQAIQDAAYSFQRRKSVETNVADDSSARVRGRLNSEGEIKQSTAILRFRKSMITLLTAWEECRNDPEAAMLLDRYDVWSPSFSQAQENDLADVIGGITKHQIWVEKFLRDVVVWKDRRPAFDRLVEDLQAVFFSISGKKAPKSKRGYSAQADEHGVALSPFNEFVWEIYDRLPETSDDTGLLGKDPIAAFAQRVFRARERNEEFSKRVLSKDR